MSGMRIGCEHLVEHPRDFRRPDGQGTREEDRMVEDDQQDRGAPQDIHPLNARRDPVPHATSVP